MQAILARAATSGVSRQRICSGACPFFSEQYKEGRKVPGSGTCGYHLSYMAVRVGTLCSWTQPAASALRALTAATSMAQGISAN